MKCLEAQQRMTLYLEKRLSDKELPSFLDHIDNCKECREELDLYLAFYLAVNDDEQEVSGSYVMGQTLAKRMLSSRKYLRRSRAKRAIGFGGMFLVMVIALLMQYRELFVKLQRDRVARSQIEAMTEMMTEAGVVAALQEESIIGQKEQLLTEAEEVNVEADFFGEHIYIPEKRIHGLAGLVKEKRDGAGEDHSD